MKKIVFIFALVLLNYSCIKKVPETDNYRLNILDPAYIGPKWFTFDDLYLFTDSNNDQKVYADFTIPGEMISDLKPSHFWVQVKLNDSDSVLQKIPINSQGDYSSTFSMFPDGSDEYCLTLAVYIESEDSQSDGFTVNPFTECMAF